MKLYKSIPLNQNFSKKLVIEAEHSERLRRVNQTGGNYIVIYDFIIMPNGINSIDVCFEDDYKPEDYITNPTRECIPYILEGVEEFVKLMDDKEISISGFQFRVSDSFVHIIDFRPSAYKQFTAKRLMELVFEIGKSYTAD